MYKRIAVLAAAATVCLGSLGVVEAQATSYAAYAVHAPVGPGENYFGGVWNVIGSLTEPAGTALACAGIRGYGLVCSSFTGEAAMYELGSHVNAEPYMHNHSTWASYFSGYRGY